MINDLLRLSPAKKWSRREFLRNASAATLTALSSGLPRPSLAIDNPKLNLPRSADAVILLWMAGGMAHTETFDPKKVTSYRKGIRYNFIRCTFPSIDSVVDDIKISSGLEQIAKVMDRVTLVRSFAPPDLGHILHARHQYHFHTGYQPPQTTPAPHIGSTIVKTLGAKNDDLPAFVHIGQRLDIDGSPEVRAFLTPGFLGHEYAPLFVPYPERAMQALQPPEGFTPTRFQNRQKLYQRLLAHTPIGEFGSDYQQESLLRAMERGHRLLTSPARSAFDLTLEPAEVKAEYDSSRFGRGCLLARRLIEAGVRFVEVSSEHVPFGNWDTHNDGHERTKLMKEWIDRPVARLILDLEERGLLDRTLIVLASEFSRTATRKPHEIHPNNPDFIVRNPKQYGLHKHFTKAGSLLLVGGGAKKGFVYGRTSDEVPCETIENPVLLEDFHATIFHTLGIPPDLSYEVEQRPFYVTEDGKGKAILDLLDV